VGYQAFTAALKQYVLENTLKIASGSDFFKAVRMNTDADLAPLLKQFFQNPPSY